MMKWLILVCLAGILLVPGCLEAPRGQGTSFNETTFTVEAGEKHTVAVFLGADQTVEGFFSVSGTEDTIDFYVKDPDKAIVFGVVRAVGGQSFEIKAKMTGTHVLYFDNSISFGFPRQVSLRYRTR